MEGKNPEVLYAYRLFRSDACFFLLSNMERKTISMFIVELKWNDVSSIAGYLLYSGLMFAHIFILFISAQPWRISNRAM
jgi:hypothetical protein